MPRRRRVTVDIVLPLYNEKDGFERTYRDLRAAIDKLPYEFTLLCVDDGSTDGNRRTGGAESAKRDRRIRLVQLSRNFGHQAALTAGLAAVHGDVVVTMDGDGQHPPELLPQMLDLVMQGYDIVQGQRVESVSSGGFKQWTSGTFYQFLNLISGTHVLPGAADFRALSRQAVDALNSMPEYHRFLRGMISWMGFSQRHPAVPRNASALRASPSTRLSKMIKLALDAVFSFSLAPLYVGLSLGGRAAVPGGARDGLRAVVLDHGPHQRARTGLELADVRHPDRRRHADAAAGLRGRVRGLHLPGSQAAAGLPCTKREPEQ